MGGAESSMASNHLLLPSRLEDQRFLSVGHLPMPGAPSDNIESNHYKFLLDALLALLHTELDLLFYAFSNEFKSLVFTNLIAIPLECMQREAHKLCETVRQLPNKISTGKPYLHGILSILDWFLRSKRKFTKIYHVSLFERSPQIAFSDLGQQLAMRLSICQQPLSDLRAISQWRECRDAIHRKCF